MSHGSTGDKCEPNLTPLLDLVLQLVMFFMLCANFVMEQTSGELELPTAIAAIPLDKSLSDIIVLNVTKEKVENGVVTVRRKILINKDETADNMVQVKNRLDNYFGSPTGDSAAKVKARKAAAVVILRADKATPFQETHDIMQACRLSGYERVQFRAETKRAKE